MIDPSNVAICIFITDDKQDGWAGGSKQARSKHGQKMKKKFCTPLIGNSDYRLYDMTERNWIFNADSLVSGCCCRVFFSQNLI